MAQPLLTGSLGVRLPGENLPMSSQETLQKSTPHRIPSLEGCRALFICLVILCHVCATPQLQAFNPWARMIYHFGSPGVKVFFVIFGFLITALLLREERQNGTISIKEIYG